MRTFKSTFGGILLATMAMVGCTSATLNEPSACDGQSVSFTFPNLPSVNAGSNSLTIPQAQTSTSLDLSSTLNSITSVASNVNIGVNEFSLNAPNGELSWVSSIAVDIQGSDQENYPQTGFAFFDGSGTPTLEMTPNTLLSYLQSGPVTLTIFLGPTGGTVVNQSTVQMLQGLNGQVEADVMLCLSVSGGVSKSL